MTQELINKDFEKRLQEVLAFAKKKEIFIGAVQQLNKDSLLLETVPWYRDLKSHVLDAEPKKK